MKVTNSQLTGESEADTKSAAAVLPWCLVQDLFIRQAEASPDRPAVICGTTRLSYGELLRLSRSWGTDLRSRGAKPNTLVAVVMQKGWEQVVAVLAILESGAAYLPIDASLPNDRLWYLLGNSEAEIVLTQLTVDKSREWPSGIERISIDAQAPKSDGNSPLGHPQTPDDLAYVLYTSGSTGAPKGVMIAHHGIVNCLLDTNRTFNIGPDDRVLGVSALHHDMSVFDMFSILAAGGTIVLPDPCGSRSPDHWIELIKRERITIWNSVPGFMEMLLEYAASHHLSIPGTLRLAFLGGDWIPVSAPERIRRHFGDVQVVSVGGPTETTLWNIWYPIGQVDPKWQSIPYGHAIANTRYYVLDGDLREVPASESGELCCSGVGLMKGYWGDEGKTAEKLATLPATGEMVCRTGDRGRLRPDGEIEFLGRIDSQVKINGQRIELGEIEATLTQHPGIRRAAVKVVEVGNQKSLAAYFTADSASVPTPSELRGFLSKQLPSYMIPSAFTHLGSMPLNSNGKVDRTALPHPEQPRGANDCHSRGTEIENLIAQIWASTLCVSDLGFEDNFFDIGGNSLLLVRAHSELEKQMNRSIPVTKLFEFPTVRSLAKHLEIGTQSLVATAIDERAQRRRAAMTRIQDRSR